MWYPNQQKKSVRSLSILYSEQPLTEFVEKEVPPPVEQQSTSSIGANIFRRAFLEARTNRNNSTKNYRKLGSPEATKIALICSLYQTALHTLTQMKIEILTGIYNRSVLQCKMIHANDIWTNNIYKNRTVLSRQNSLSHVAVFDYPGTALWTESVFRSLGS